MCLGMEKKEYIVRVRGQWCAKGATQDTKTNNLKGRRQARGEAKMAESQGRGTKRRGPKVGLR